MECAGCGQEIIEGERVGAELYCSECYDELPKCEGCGDVIVGESFCYEDNLYCEDCMGCRSGCSDRCGALNWEENIFYYEDEMMCADCYRATAEELIDEGNRMLKEIGR